VTDPVAEHDARYGEEGAGPPEWSRVRDRMARAGVAWFTTTRPEGGPHITPLVFVWHEGAPWMCTGPGEQKARNIAADPRCALLTGTDELHEGIDVVVEGTAVRETETATLEAVAAAFLAKYGEEWHFGVAGDAFTHGPGRAHVFRIAPGVAYSFGKSPYTHTRWRFSQHSTPP
jgi:general stress protein 26